MLDRLDAAVVPDDLDLPGYRFHRLTGDQKARFSVRVSGNWRLTFGFDGQDCIDVDLEDYHGPCESRCETLAAVRRTPARCCVKTSCPRWA